MRGWKKRKIKCMVQMTISFEKYVEDITFYARKKNNIKEWFLLSLCT